MFSKITGTGSYLPERVITNAELEAGLDTTDEWIRTRTGIKQRHIAAPDESNCDMAEQAARRALAAAGVTDIDMLIVATTTPDRIFPSTACLLQARLGLSDTPAFDIQAVCSGFIYAMSIADQYIRTGVTSSVLIVGSETLSRVVDWNDRATCVLFGDGAGAVVLQSAEEPGIYSTHLHADGTLEKILYVPGGVGDGGNCTPERPGVVMQGGEVFKQAVTVMDTMVEEVLTHNNMKQTDIDWLIPHQANERIIKAAARKLGLPLERVALTVAQHGNTSAASIPLALDTLVQDGRIRAGDCLLMEAVGAGMTWGSALLRF